MENLKSSSLNWKQIVRMYNKPNSLKSSWQIASTLFLYVLSWFIAYEAWAISPWLTFSVAIIAQVFFGRIFIFMHDCGHGSFFKSKKARNFWGHVTGIIWMTPYLTWTKDHATHHKNSGNLDHRGVGDIWTLTSKEYEQASSLKKLGYRVCRWPLFVVGVGGLYVYFFQQRFSKSSDGKKERRCNMNTNIAILVQAVIISVLTSIEFYLFYQFFLVYFGSALAVFFFYVQHQYEEVYWSKGDDWSYETAALEGSSYLELPKLVQWSSGNIGFHHIHHLSHAIPNYNLERAFTENAMFQKPIRLNLVDCFKCFNLALIDEENGGMITFKQFKNKVNSPLAHEQQKYEELLHI